VTCSDYLLFVEGVPPQTCALGSLGWTLAGVGSCRLWLSSN
jgi:hypothetical protein